MHIFARSISIVIVIATFLSAQSLTGTYTVQLKGPADGEQVNNAKSGARAELRSSVSQWLISTRNYQIDTFDVLSNLYIEILTDSLINHGKEESSFKGKELTILYSVSETEANDVLTAYDKVSEESILKNWSDMAAAKQNNNMADYLEAAVKTYVYAYGHLGNPVAVPGADSTTITMESKKIVQSLFNNLKIQSSDMILKGKIGRTIDEAPAVTVFIDSMPIHNMWFAGYLQIGNNCYYASTDDNGQLVLKDLITPLVSNGAMFYLTPDIGKMMSAPVSITPKDLKIQLKDGLTQTFMFKVTQPTYTLDYKVKSDPSVNLPPEFSSSATLKKYLKDSCYIVDAMPGIPPDFIITVESAVSNAAIDITDEMGLKLNIEISIKGLSLETPKTETKKIEHIKRYGKRTDIPYGLFLWDMNTLLKHSIKVILNKL